LQTKRLLERHQGLIARRAPPRQEQRGNIA
jgi:hypothetical protein